MGIYSSVNETCELLTRYGISPTQQRIRIAQVLCSKPRHLSAEQILDEVNQESTHVSKATIYNTLNLFAEKGLVREVVVDPAKVFYDSTTTSHHHFYNEDTGELIDIDEGVINLQSLPAAPDGMQLSGIDIVVRIRNAS
jgi:Fur family iron response transcriptional regulator